MSEPETSDETPRGKVRSRSIEPAFGPLALWTALSFALLVLAIMGPKLWATQPAENATIAVEIVAGGQALLGVILWPIWTRTCASALGAVLSSPAWLLLAGRIAAIPVEATVGLLWKLASVLTLLAVVRLVTRRGALAFIWAILVAVALGGPTLWLLSRGG